MTTTSQAPQSHPPPSVPDPQENQPSFPLAAQIPLQSFTLPHFPSEASRLRELTLTSDIKLDDYQTLVSSDTSTSSAPELPESITHLTLELFSLGFPGGWLTALGTALPNLKSVTLFSCLFDGLDDSTRADAEGFVKVVVGSGLRELHLIDTFARPGFFGKVGEMMQQEKGAESDGKPGEDGQGKEIDGEVGVKVVDVTYTYRGHEDKDFLGRVNGEELVGLLGGKGLVGFGCRFVPEMANAEGMKQVEGENGEEEKVGEGILPFASDSRASVALKRRIEIGSGKGVLKEVKVLDLSMWTLKASEVGEVLYACSVGEEAGLQALTVSVLMEVGWFEKLMEGCKYKGAGKALQMLEVVGVPGGLGGGLLGTEEGMKSIGEVCPSLERFEMSILRSTTAGMVRLVKKEGKWSME